MDPPLHNASRVQVLRHCGHPCGNLCPVSSGPAESSLNGPTCMACCRLHLPTNMGAPRHTHTQTHSSRVCVWPARGARPAHLTGHVRPALRTQHAACLDTVPAQANVDSQQDTCHNCAHLQRPSAATLAARYFGQLSGDALALEPGACAASLSSQRAKVNAEYSRSAALIFSSLISSPCTNQSHSVSQQCASETLPVSTNLATVVEAKSARCFRLWCFSSFARR